MTTLVTTRLEIPADILDRFESQADNEGRTLDSVVADHLRKSSSASTSSKPLILEDHHRRELERLLARNFNAPETLVHAVAATLAIEVADTTIELEPRLLQRLRSRAIGVEFPKYLEQTIIRALETEAGMR